MVRKEGAVSKISSPDISDEELGLTFVAITTAASRFRRTLDDGHLCSRCLWCSSFLSLHRNTDEYQYYFPLGGKRHWMVAMLPDGGGQLSQLKQLFFILSKCIFVAVRGCVTWLNEFSGSASTKHAFSFFLFGYRAEQGGAHTWHMANTAGFSAKMKDCNQSINQKSLRSNPPPLSDVVFLFFLFFFCTSTLCRCHLAAWHV